MDRRFLAYYDRELRFVRDLAHEFATDHARIADRFGLGPDACADPHVEWLMDGFAFLTARVQQKLDGEYEHFTHHLAEMVYPDLLAPTPAAAIVRCVPEANPAPLEAGYLVPRGTRLLALRAAPGDRTRCTFTTAHPVTLWPLRIAAADYVSGPALQAVPLAAGARAAIHLRLETLGGLPMARIALDRLPLHLAGADSLAHRLHEAMLAHPLALVTGGTPPRRLPAEAIRRQGFADDEALLPQSPVGFSGYRLLREYFTLPERFLFVELEGLAPAVRAATGTTLDLWVLLDAVDRTLEGAVTAAQLVPFATPAINLFPRRAKPILVEAHEREHHVMGDRTRPLDYEIHSVTAVTGSSEDERERLPFARFYAIEHLADPVASRAFWAAERRPRLVTEGEAREGRSPDERRRLAARSSYLGSELFLTLCDGNAAPWPSRLHRLEVDTLCTNRDLPLRLPLPQGESHFSAEQGGPLAGILVVGRMTRPAPSMATADTADSGPHGRVGWRLIGHLALNYLSLLDRPEEGADALRSLLALYAATAEPATARQVDGVRSVNARKVTRRLPGPGPICFGRGLEVTLELAESAFPQGGAFLLGSVLEVFLRRHVALNSFVETALVSSERGPLHRFAAQLGTRAAA